MCTIHLEKLLLEEESIINYSIFNYRFGKMLIASSAKGVCLLEFIDSDQTPSDLLLQRFKGVSFKEHKDKYQIDVINFLQHPEEIHSDIYLQLDGTDFQFSVWSELLNIPSGTTVSYSEISKRIGMPKASRAVGTAVGKNPIAIIIPCHRVISSTGKIGQYHWGVNRKIEILKTEC